MKYRKLLQALLSSFLAFLGVSCQQEGDEYGCPTADFYMKGSVVNQKGEPVPGVEPEVDINESMNILLNNQGTIYNDMISSFAQLQQMVSDLATTCSAQPAVVPAEPVIDEKEQQRLELQAQIEALQAQMQSL